MIRSVPCVDRLDRDGRTLLLFDASFLELNPVALALWEHTHEARTAEEVTAHLVEAFGEPEEGSARAMVEALVATLADHGAVEVVDP